MNDQQMASRKIRPILKKHGVKRAAFFGSFARGTARKTSDIDLLVAFSGRKSFLDLVGLKLDLEDILGRKVDVATESALRPRVAVNVKKDMVTIL